MYVFGLNDDKLADFTFADGAYKTTEVPEGFTMDHAFECVGGNGSPIAIEQIIGLIKPEATLSILGVSEYPVPINTRMILEKGLRVFGSSRSGVADFEKTVQMYQQYPEIIDYLGNLISSVNVVRTTPEQHDAIIAYTSQMGLPGVLADLIHNSLLQGVAKGGLAYVHPHPLKIFKLFQPHSDGAADQAQANDADRHFAITSRMLRTFLARSS